MFATPQFHPSAEPALLLGVVRFRLETHDFSLCFLPKVFADEHRYVPVDVLPGSGHALIRPIKLITAAHNYILGDRMEVGERQSTWSVLPYQ